MTNKQKTQRRAALPGTDPLVAHQLPFASEFSSDPELSDPMYLLRTLCEDEHAHIRAALDEKTTVCVDGGGRHRKTGSWALAYIAFLLSDVIDVKTWCDRNGSKELWELCGFGRWRPNYRTVHLRFTEMEACREAFTEEAVKLIQNAMEKDPLIGLDVHVDGTHFTTHARLEHCCPDEAECKRKWKETKEGKKPKKFLTKATHELVKAERHRESAEPEPEPGTKRARQLASVMPGDPRLDSFEDEVVERYAFFELTGHLYRTRDMTTGVRHYKAREGKNGKPGSREKFTEGGLLLMATDDYVGAPLAVHCDSVGENEFDAYPELLDQLVATTRGRTRTVVTDRGFHVGEVFRLNVRHGISTIAPWRENHRGKSPEELECEKFDRHGVVRCRHCGGPTTMYRPGLGFYTTESGEPRLRVQCVLARHTKECKKSQSLSCYEEPRLVQPISRAERLHHELIHAHNNKESLFHHWRRRYAVAGNDYSERPKRRQCVPCQALRASAGLFVEWFRLSLRHGWIDGHRNVIDSKPVPRESAAGWWQKVITERKDTELNAPYGPAAYELKLCVDDRAPGAISLDRQEDDPTVFGPQPDPETEKDEPPPF